MRIGLETFGQFLLFFVRGRVKAAGVASGKVAIAITIKLRQTHERHKGTSSGDSGELVHNGDAFSADDFDHVVPEVPGERAD